METLNIIQCKEARMLLRWNIRDLAHHANIDARRLQLFENAHENLYPAEIKQLIDAFMRHNIEFSDGGSVMFVKETALNPRHLLSSMQETSKLAADVLARLLADKS